MKIYKKKRRKKKSPYHTGIYVSTKCSKKIEYRSGWEKEVCIYLDRCANVVSYSYESIIIPYISNVKTGKIRKYYPDFYVEYNDGTRKLIEVKRADRINSPKVVKKSEAAKKWCERNGVVFEIWSNIKISQIKTMNELLSPKKEK
jgi:hypothetical protein